MRDLERLIGELNPNLRAHYFLKKLRVGGDKESQVITGAGNRYEYESLRESAVSCIPRVAMLGSHQRGPPPAPGFQASHRGGKRGGGRGGRRSYHTEHSEGTDEANDEREEDEDVGAEDQESGGVEPPLAPGFPPRRARRRRQRRQRAARGCQPAPSPPRRAPAAA